MIFFNKINSHVTTLDGIRGVVKFHGPVEVSENRYEDMVGVLLEEVGSGDSNGEFNGKIYFVAKENSAIFISVDEVVHLDHTLLVNVSKVTTPDGKIGVVKFIDIIKFSVGKTIVKKEIVGIEVFAGVEGDSNGILNGKKYFDTTDYRAIFLLVGS